MSFLSLVTLTADLDIHTRPSEGPDTSSVWMWRKSVQRSPRYFIHKQKNPQTDGAKNRTFRSSLRAVTIHTFKNTSKHTCLDSLSLKPPAPLYPLQDFKALYKYCIIIIIIIFFLPSGV